MRIDNNYTQRQPNFGRLKSITYNHRFINPDFYPEEFAKLLNTIKESKAFNEFFKQYDVDMSFHGTPTFGVEYIYMKLKTTVPKTKGNNLRPELFFDAGKFNEFKPSTSTLLNRLIQKIKNIEFSDLKYKLDDALKTLEENEKKKKFDEITDNLLSPEKSEKKTFFEKLFGWLK